MVHSERKFVELRDIAKISIDGRCARATHSSHHAASMSAVRQPLPLCRGQNISTLLQGIQDDPNINALKRVEELSARPVHAKRLITAGAVHVVSQCLRDHPILRQTAAACIQNLAVLEEGNQALQGTGTVKSLCDCLSGYARPLPLHLLSRPE